MTYVYRDVDGRRQRSRSYPRFEKHKHYHTYDRPVVIRNYESYQPEEDVPFPRSRSVSPSRGRGFSTAVPPPARTPTFASVPLRIPKAQRRLVKPRKQPLGLRLGVLILPFMCLLGLLLICFTVTALATGVMAGVYWRSDSSCDQPLNYFLALLCLGCILAAVPSIMALVILARWHKQFKRWKEGYRAHYLKRDFNIYVIGCSLAGIFYLLLFILLIIGTVWVSSANSGLCDDLLPPSKVFVYLGYIFTVIFLILFCLVIMCAKVFLTTSAVAERSRQRQRYKRGETLHVTTVNSIHNTRRPPSSALRRTRSQSPIRSRRRFYADDLECSSSDSSYHRGFY